MSTFSSWSPEKAAAISAKNRAARGILVTPTKRYDLSDERCIPKPSKYKNVKVSVDGEIVDSKKEAKRLAHLRLLARGGFIQELARQVEFTLRTNDSTICVYRADFVYTDAAGRKHVEDVKSDATRKLKDYVLKKKMMRACLGIEVEEV